MPPSTEQAIFTYPIMETARSIHKTGGIGSVYIFTYSGDSVIVLNTDSGFVSKTTYANNAAGLPPTCGPNMTRRAPTGALAFTNTTGKNSAKRQSLPPPVAARMSILTPGSIIIWCATAGPTTTVYDYYTDKPEQSGDYFSFFQSIQGGETIRNKNLVKSATGVAFNYAFDADGNISSLELAGTNSVAVLTYTYQCN